MGPAFDTIRSRILAGLVPLVVGLVGAALLGAATLRQMREVVATELEGLRASSEVGSGLVTTVFQEMRAAEQYLATPGPDARRQFQAAADEAFQYQRRLEMLDLTAEDRVTVTRLDQLHASIQTEYSLAHALRDLDREHEAQARSVAVRPQAAELTRLVRELSARQAAKATQAAGRLAAASKQREQALWLILAAIAVGAVFVARWTLQSVHGPLARLVTAAARAASI